MRWTPAESAWAGLSLTVGLALGVGGYTFVFARGASYMTDNAVACVDCHASVYVPYKKLGEGDLIRGFGKMNPMLYAESRAEARDFRRKARFLLDFVEAENSTGFHAPQEAARILGESINYSRLGQASLRPRRMARYGIRIDLPSQGN